MRLLGRNTKVLQPETDVADARQGYLNWYAVVCDAKRDGIQVIDGSVLAVSKTRDGAFRALYHIGPLQRRVSLAKLG